MYDIRTEPVKLIKKEKTPDDYACDCKYCQKYFGMLIRPDGRKYNRNDRRKYYYYKHGGGGAGHINPTPLHVARWAIQNLTKPGDIVIDPFAGTGTTIVEAINHGRSAIGTELDTIDLARRNIKSNVDNPTELYDPSCIAKVHHDDARNLDAYVHDGTAQLVILHPPYSGDEQSNAKYDPNVKKNLAFLKESSEYWKVIDYIYRACYAALKPGGYMVIGIKEMMRNKQWWDLHIKHSAVLDEFMTYKGMVMLPHYPRTLHLNTYYKRYGIHPSYYQTCTIFKKEEA